MRNSGVDKKKRDIKGGLSWVLSYVRPHRKIFIPSVIALFVTAGLSLAFPWFLKDLVGDPADAWKRGVDAVATRQKADEKILWLVVILAVQAFIAYWRVRGFTGPSSGVSSLVDRTRVPSPKSSAVRLAVILGTRDGRAMVTERVSGDSEEALVGGLVVSAEPGERALVDLSEAIAAAVRALMGEPPAV